MGKKYEIKENHKYVQDNRMITAEFSSDMTLFAQKLLRLAITSIDSVNDDFFSETTVNLMDYAEQLHITDFSNMYRDVKKASSTILQTHLLVEDKRSNKKKFKKYNLFSSFGYDDGKATISWKFNTDMAPLLLHLRSNFTQIPLADILLMDHKYSIRVYELIKYKLQDNIPHADKHYMINITVDELRKFTNTEKTYSQIRDLKKRVLYPALEDIEKLETAQLHCNIVREIKIKKQIVAFDIDCWSWVGWGAKELNKDQIEGQETLFDYIKIEPS